MHYAFDFRRKGSSIVRIVTASQISAAGSRAASLTFVQGEDAHVLRHFVPRIVPDLLITVNNYTLTSLNISL